MSPVPKGAGYTFNVAPERQAWVESKVRSTPSPNGNAAWIIHIKQLGRLNQRIQLELLGDGITGIVYEAGPEGIVPLRSRLAGPAGAFVVLAVHLLLWGGFWLFGVGHFPLLAKRFRQRATTGAEANGMKRHAEGLLWFASFGCLFAAALTSSKVYLLFIAVVWAVTTVALVPLHFIRAWRKHGAVPSKTHYAAWVGFRDDLLGSTGRRVCLRLRRGFTLTRFLFSH